MSQDFSEKGRIEWAIRTFGEGKAALEQEDFDTAIATLKESITAFPFPRTLELLGECLLLENKPAEATLYLAAAIGMAKDYQFRPLLLLGKALAAANDTYVSKIKLEHALSITTDAEAQDLLNEVKHKATLRVAIENIESIQLTLNFIDKLYEKTANALMSSRVEFNNLKQSVDKWIAREKPCNEQLRSMLKDLEEINDEFRELSTIIEERCSRITAVKCPPT